MASEAVLVQDMEDRHLEVEVADGTSISKGTLLILSDPNTGSSSTGTDQIFGGILLADKAANDGATRMSVARENSIWDIFVHTGNTVSCGDKVTLSGNNMIIPVDTSISDSMIVGTALQDGAIDEQIMVRLGS